MRYLSEMLPFDPAYKEAKKGIKEFQLLLKGLEGALRAFQKGELEKFDCLVGENACQIRALWVSLIDQKQNLNEASLLARVEEAYAKRGGVPVGSLKNFLETEGVDILLPLEAYHLTQLYLLTAIKVRTGALYEGKETTDPKRLQALGEVTISSARRLISKLRKEVAATSVALIQEHTTGCPLYLESLVVQHNECWPCIPMFLTYQTLLDMSHKKEIPIVIHITFHLDGNHSECIEEAYLYYHQHELITPSEADLEKAAIVIQGCISAPSLEKLPSLQKWKEVFTSFPLRQVILAGAADHRQYPNVIHDQLFELLADSEFHELKMFAKKEGFSVDNPSTFLIRHVYPTKGKNIHALTAA